MSLNLHCRWLFYSFKNLSLKKAGFKSRLNMSYWSKPPAIGIILTYFPTCFLPQNWLTTLYHSGYTNIQRKGHRENPCIAPGLHLDQAWPLFRSYTVYSLPYNTPIWNAQNHLHYPVKTFNGHKDVNFE